MFKKGIYIIIIGSLIAVGALISIRNKLPLGLTILLLSVFPISGLLISKTSFRKVLPDLIFGGIDTGILVIPALWGGYAFGVAGAIAGGIIGDALTDGAAGFFEGSIAEWLREKGFKESREPVPTSLGKMAGCLLGAGIVLCIASMFAIFPKFK